MLKHASSCFPWFTAADLLERCAAGDSLLPFSPILRVVGDQQDRYERSPSSGRLSLSMDFSFL
jgi:hypothetical protein